MSSDMSKEFIECNRAIQLNKDIETVYTAHSGDTLRIRTMNAYGDKFQNLSEFMSVLQNKYSDKHHHPLTGPIDVEGAEPGDVLKVYIKRIDVEYMAQALSKSAGISPIKIHAFSDRSPILSSHLSSKDRDLISYFSGMRVPHRPMLGMIGTAPKSGFIKTGHAGKTGGNLDIPFITEGVVVYLPVEVAGGKLFIGDVHGAQGYGELSGIALEATAEVTIQVTLLKSRTLFVDGIKSIFSRLVVIGEEPFSNKQAIGFIGVSNTFGDLIEAVRDSYESAIYILKPFFPVMTTGYLKNLITIIGNSMNGQVYSKTSESTSIINVLEDDLRIIKKDSRFTLLRDFDRVWFQS